MSPLLLYILAEAWALEPNRAEVFRRIVEARFSADGGLVGVDGSPAAASLRDDAIANGSGGGMTEGGYFKQGSLMVVPVVGPISKYASMVHNLSTGAGASVQRVSQVFDAAVADPDRRAVLLKIDSPGGSAAGSFTLAEKVLKAREAGVHVYSYADDLMASAGYLWGAMGKEIYGTSIAHVGSIGVYRLLRDTSKAMEAGGVKVHLVKAGKSKGAGIEGVEVTPESLATIQREVDAIYDRFKALVVQGRPGIKSAIDDLADGSVLTGSAAVAAGLMDHVMSFEEVVDRLNRRHGPRSVVSSASSRASVSHGDHAEHDGDDSMKNLLNGLLLRVPDAPTGSVGGGDAGDPAKVAKPAEISPTVLAAIGEAAGKAAADAIKAESHAATKAEAARVASIEAAAAKFAHVAGVAELVTEAKATPAMTVAAFQEKMLDAIAGDAKPEGSLEVSVGTPGEVRERDAMELAIITRAVPNLSAIAGRDDDASISLLAKLGCPDVATLRRRQREAASHFGRLRLRDAAERTLKLKSLAPKHRRGDRAAFASDTEFVGASLSHSTSDFPLLLENSISKILLAGFAQQRTTWRKFAAKGSASDFKETSILSLGELGELEEIPEGDNAKETTLDERGERISLKTLGRKLKITRQTIINDDLGALTQLPLLFGRMAARAPENLVYTLLRTNPNMRSDGQPYFSAAHKNRANPGTPLSFASLEAAVTAMRQQKAMGASNEAWLDIVPSVLVVPTALGMLARKIVDAEHVFDNKASTSQTEQVPNAVGRYFAEDNVIDTPRLDAAPTGYYLFADPNETPAIMVNFLEGNEEPIIAEIETGSTLAREWEIIFDCGVGFASWEAAYFNPGQ